MTLRDFRDRMDREFAAVRRDLKRIDGHVSAIQNDAAAAREFKARLRRSLALLHEIEWVPNDRDAGKRHHRRCPVCGGAEPEHTHGCRLAAAVAALAG